MEKVEILAPAGNMECFLAAINAGADAVYMAGKAFGARASANNFTEEEFVRALNIAHIHGRKIYLTLNTLIKEREWKDIYSFLKPLYEAGLDGVIIQDYGLIEYLGKQFPELLLHASTQMTITDSRSASLLKERGICRVVPARELSLKEIEVMKKETGLEIETFIHGALCYCYSGQCLFSSYLGGRSGNRGRCAGPCRLPYEVQNLDLSLKSAKEYPLSLKDLCTIEHVGELIEAGIDSFKIEGRMKSPEYVAGVTSIYRKYVDMYYSGKNCKVSAEDIHTLESLYLRSSIGSGYYYKHNGAEMISISDPSYNNQDATVVKSVHDGIIQIKASKEVYCNAYIHVGEPMSLSVWDMEGRSVTVSGAEVYEASNRAASAADIEKQLNKTGATEFFFKEIGIDLEDNCFVPVKLLNELRREALEKFEEEILKEYRRETPAITNSFVCRDEKVSSDRVSFGISVLTMEALKTVMAYEADRLYIPYDLFYKNDISINDIANYKKKVQAKLILTLPRIIRLRDKNYIEKLMDFLRDNISNSEKQSGLFEGVLIKNLEEVKLIEDMHMDIYKELDYSLYGWNKNSQEFLMSYGDRLTTPLELSAYELMDLDNRDMCLPIYGYAPLMVAANCLAKTYGECSQKRYGFDYELKDRYHKTEHAFVNCIHCYSEIYNAVPTSYHKKFDDFVRQGYRRFRIDFTLEKSKECERVLDYYLKGNKAQPPVDEFTSGHIDKGAI